MRPRASRRGKIITPYFFSPRHIAVLFILQPSNEYYYTRTFSEEENYRHNDYVTKEIHSQATNVKSLGRSAAFCVFRSYPIARRNTLL